MNPRGRIFTGALVVVVLGFVGALGWAVLLLTESVGTEEVRLRPGSEKTFGRFDPHLHGAVREVSAPESWGEGGERLLPQGRLILVAFRLRCSAAEITIAPSFLRVAMVDDEGREHAPLAAPPRGAVAPATRIEDEVGRSRSESCTSCSICRRPRGVRRCGSPIRSGSTASSPGTKTASSTPGSCSSFTETRGTA